MGPVVANRFCNDVLRIEVQSIFLNRLNANVAENHGKALAFAGAEGEKVQVPASFGKDLRATQRTA